MKNLRFEVIRKAYRDQIKLYHPDLQIGEPQNVINLRAERFRNIRDSYERLSAVFMSERLEFPEAAPLSEPAARKCTIIAVGGAKGGIGKSMFSANLAVFLARMGWKTVAVDLDLGGANLHLFLGEKILARDINDFLNKKVSSLMDIAVKSKYGPELIGGDSSQLGIANIHFSRKIMLLREIRKIDADYVIVDLGGDTSYNVIDFFLAADHKIVMTTCDPASYLDAYRFIKVSLYRKLDRLFGVESQHYNQKIPGLQRLIHESIMDPDGQNVQSVAELMSIIKRQYPEQTSLVNGLVKAYEPYLIVNQSQINPELTQIVSKIQKIAREKCSIKVNFLGNIPCQTEIEDSARKLVPVVATFPNGVLANTIGRMVKKIVL